VCVTVLGTAPAVQQFNLESALDDPIEDIVEQFGSFDFLFILRKPVLRLTESEVHRFMAKVPEGA
jgi:hypothetical protein